MAMAIGNHQSLTIKEVPEIEGFSKIQNEISFLQKVVHMRGDGVKDEHVLCSIE